VLGNGAGDYGKAQAIACGPGGKKGVENAIYRFSWYAATAVSNLNDRETVVSNAATYCDIGLGWRRIERIGDQVTKSRYQVIVATF
jgi:hypothetical protein